MGSLTILLIMAAMADESIPREADEGHAQEVREIKTESGCAFELIDRDVRDVVLICDGPMVEAMQVSSDFRWTWLRFERSTDRLKEMVLLDGRSLRINGRSIFEAVERAAYVVVERTGSELRVETNAVSAFDIASLGASRAVIGDQSCQSRGDSILHFEDGRWQSEPVGQIEAETLI